MRNEKKIRKLAQRFSALDLLMLSLVAKWFLESGDKAPQSNPELERHIRHEIDEIYTHSAREADKLVREAYANEYKKEMNKDKAFWALLSGAALAGRGGNRFNQMGAAAIQNTQKVISAAVNAIPFRFQRAQTEAVNRVVALYSQGGMTWLQAKQKVLNELADQGMIHFIDQANRHWDMDAYVEMGVRTGIANASRAGFIQAMGDQGHDLVFPSAHPGACPKCALWEGVVLSISGDNPDHPSLQDAIDSGLFHPNCKHRLLKYIEGFSELISYAGPENEQLYKDTQRQRQMERTLRQWKRREVAAIYPGEKTRAKSYARKWSKELDRFTKEKGLARKRYREVV